MIYEMVKGLLLWGSLGISVFVLWQWPDSNLRVVFCDVGQADAAIISLKQVQIVIDGGYNGEKLIACLGRHIPFWDKKIEVVINTHPEADHLGGLGKLFEMYQVDRLLINGFRVESKEGERFREILVTKETMLISPVRGDVLRMGNLVFDILWPVEKIGDASVWREGYGATGEEGRTGAVLGESDSYNDYSIVGRLVFGEFAVLFTGDIGEDEEGVLVGREAITGIDVLKVAHHGSKFSSGMNLLTRLRPKEAVISVGKNSYGHPSKEVLERLREVGSRIYRTDINGEIEFVSDGKRYWVKKER